MKTRSGEDATTPAEYVVKQLASIIDSYGELYSVLEFVADSEYLGVRAMMRGAENQLDEVLIKLKHHTQWKSNE